jgi:hypothetical protein
MPAITSGLLAAALNDKVINEAFEIARSNRTGILSVVGMGSPRQAYEGYKMGWLDFRIDATSSATTAAVLIGATTVPVVDGSKFRAGMTLSPTGSQEVILVTAVSGNNLTVVRGFGGSTAAALTDGQVLTIDSVGREENSLAENDGIFQPDSVENFFQTMDTAVEFSRRALSTIQFGDTNSLAFQVSERIRQLTIQMDRALVRGRRAVATIGGKEVTYTGGLRFYATQVGGINTELNFTMDWDLWVRLLRSGAHFVEEHQGAAHFVRGKIARCAPTELLVGDGNALLIPDEVTVLVVDLDVGKIRDASDVGWFHERQPDVDQWTALAACHFRDDVALTDTRLAPDKKRTFPGDAVLDCQLQPVWSDASGLENLVLCFCGRHCFGVLLM